MLAKLSSDVFDHDKWIYEKKLDGYRAISYTGGAGVKLISRNGIDFSSKYNGVINALKKFLRILLSKNYTFTKRLRGYHSPPFPQIITPQEK